MYRLIEQLWPADPVEVGGQSLPVPSVVEDDDGQRIAVVRDGLSGPQRTRAVDAGVVMLVRLTDGYQAGEWPEEWSGDWSDVSSPQEFVAPPTYRELMLRLDGLTQVDWDARTTFVHLHLHSHYSTLDGLSTIPEIVEQIRGQGQGAVGITDHGNVAGHPEFDAVCRAEGLKPVFGMEAYFVPDRHRRARSWVELDGREVSLGELSESEKKRAEKRSDATQALGEYTHLTLWALDDAGLRNLWAMSTMAYQEGLYGKPRLDWEVLERYAEGVLCGTGCLRGPLSVPLSEGDLETARQNLLRLHAIFADRLYVEIHTNQLDVQKLVNEVLMGMSIDYRIPPVAVVDSHYAVPEQKQVHRAWLAMQTNKTLTEDTSLFGGDQDYHLSTAEEVASALSYLPADFVAEAVANTVEVARRCTAKVAGEVTPPVYSKPSAEYPDPVQRDYERVLELCLANWDRRVRGKFHFEQVYLDRLETELVLLRRRAFLGYFLVTWDFVSWAKSQGCLAGPGRGSSGGCLVAYLLGITEIDPVANDLILERFLTEGRTSLPDFDIDFPSSWRERLLDYLVRRWGADHISNIGTVLKMQSKMAVNDSVRVLKGSLDYQVPYLEIESLKKAIDSAESSLAGKHLPWEEFCAQSEQVVDPLRQRYPEVFTLVDAVVGRIKTFGKHAAGVVISTDRSLSDLPMRLVDGAMVTQFDMNALELLGYVKFDLLTLRTLDTIQTALDIVNEQYPDRAVNLYDLTPEQYADPQVWQEVAAGHTLGLFQVETKAGTRLIKRLQPTSISDLSAVMALVRPGPVESGLTETYLRRRAGLEPVEFPDPRMAEVLGPTQGCIVYQEQVMAATILLAGYDSNKADSVRKLLGKKQVEKVTEAGQEFVSGCVDNGMDKQVAEQLWAQLAFFSRYAFNAAHSFGYAVLGFWTAYLRFHFPIPFLTAALATVKAERLGEFVTEARSMGYGVLGPDINASGVHFLADGMSIRYGLADVKGVGEETARAIEARAPYASLEDFTSRLLVPGTPVDSGHLRTLVSVGAFDSMIGNRRAVEAQLDREVSGEAKRCMFKVEVLNRHDLPCVYDWEHEPSPPMIIKGRGKTKVEVAKPPPKRCTVACRNYTKPPSLNPDTVEPYTPDEIQVTEKSLLGIWLSSSPFDRLDAEVWEWANTYEEVDAGPVNLVYALPVLTERVKTAKDKNGNTYAWLTLTLPTGSVDVVCFASLWERISTLVKPDALAIVGVLKNPRGLNLIEYHPT